MRILLIGGNGFIGSFLTRELQGAGHKVAILHRSVAAGSERPELVTIRGDRNDLTGCRRKMEQFAPDVVVDLILSSGEQARQLTQQAKGMAQRVVALSSMDVYRAWGVVQGVEPGSLEPLPLTEDSPRRTVRQAYPAETVRGLQSTFSWLNDEYDKIAVEDAVMGDAVVAGTVVRLPMVYGPGDRLHRFYPLLRRIADERRFILVGEDLAAWRVPRGYVENVAHALALAATSERAAGRVYNVCEEPSVEELEWQKRIAASTEWRGDFVVLPKEQMPQHLLQGGNTAQHLVASSRRIREELGYREAVDIDEAIRRTIVWEMENPPERTTPQVLEYEAEDKALAGAGME